MVDLIVDSIGRKLERNDNSSHGSDSQLLGAPQIAGGPSDCWGPLRLLGLRLLDAPQVDRAPQIVGGPSDCWEPFKLLGPLGLLGPSDCWGPLRLMRPLRLSGALQIAESPLDCWGPSDCWAPQIAGGSSDWWGPSDCRDPSDCWGPLGLLGAPQMAGGPCALHNLHNPLLRHWLDVAVAQIHGIEVLHCLYQLERPLCRVVSLDWTVHFQMHPEQSCPRVGWTRGSGRVGSGHDLAGFWRVGSGQHFGFLSFLLIISRYLNRCESSNTTLGLIDIWYNN